jgi:propanediol dehydratase small subunit
MTYPLREDAQANVRARTGRALRDITLDALRAGDVQLDDLAIHPEALRTQAEVAEENGFPQLAANLRRAAELADVPTEKVLAIYDALRPRRASYEELLALAEELERDYQAVENGRLIREAAEAYQRRGLG